LKTPREPDPETGEEFAYNTVEVINASPISAHTKGDYMGPDAVGVIVVGTSNFGATLDEPFGKLREMYDVVSIPVHEAPANPVRVVNATSAAAGPTPEEVFQKEAPGKAPEEGQTRGRTPLSPLDAPERPEKHGPLGPAPSRQKKASKDV
jgi:hypothetical protein